MKLALRFLMVLTIFSAAAMIGCEQERPVATQETAQQQPAPGTSNLQGLERSVDRLMTENNNLQQSLARQEAAIDDLRLELRSMQQQASVSAPVQVEEVEVDGFRPWQYIVVIIVILFLLFIFYRLLRPKPFEDDEDEDFSSFDDDFGFDDDEEFGEEPATSNDEERK